MKPIHRNKLWSSIVKEREIRCRSASNRVLSNDFVTSQKVSDGLETRLGLPTLLAVGPQKSPDLAVPDHLSSPKNRKDEEPKEDDAADAAQCASPHSESD